MADRSIRVLTPCRPSQSSRFPASPRACIARRGHLLDVTERVHRAVLYVESEVRSALWPGEGMLARGVETALMLKESW